MAIDFYSLGAAQEVTGSKHIMEIDGRTFMIDCGAFQGKRKEADEKNRTLDCALDKLEAVVLTHGHFDHCGMLPLLVKKGWKGNVYATPATRDLSNLIMSDSARIQARDAEYLRKQAQKTGKKFDWKPIYTTLDAIAATDQIIGVSYNRPMYIGSNVGLEFFDAGHILGSAYALFTVSGQGRGIAGDDGTVRILYTGDLGRKDKAIIRNPATNVPAPDYIFLESTYGCRKHENLQQAMQELERIVRQTVQKKGKIIIPAFAVERTQEIIYYLHLLADKKKIPHLPIYVDSPMATNATSIFRVHPECYEDSVSKAFSMHNRNPFGFNELTFINSVEESKSLNDKKGPFIIISADGMCETGRIVHHLYNNIQDSANTVLIVGFMAENTLGKRLRDGEKEVRILDSWRLVKAGVEQIHAFSAHADYTECADWLDALDTSRLRKIYLVHGEPEAQGFFTKYLAQRGYREVETVKYGETYRGCP
jgi:metallo-beta-lactamase family protein